MSPSLAQTEVNLVRDTESRYPLSLISDRAPRKHTPSFDELSSMLKKNKLTGNSLNWLPITRMRSIFSQFARLAGIAVSLLNLSNNVWIETDYPSQSCSWKRKHVRTSSNEAKKNIGRQTYRIQMQITCHFQTRDWKTMPSSDFGNDEIQSATSIRRTLITFELINAQERE